MLEITGNHAANKIYICTYPNAKKHELTCPFIDSIEFTKDKGKMEKSKASLDKSICYATVEKKRDV